jgi:hypothetical protein
MIKNFKNFSFVKTAIIVSLAFLIIVILIEFLYGLFKYSFDDAMLNLSNTKYLIRKFVAAIIYGLIMTLYFKRKKKKAS